MTLIIYAYLQVRYILNHFSNLFFLFTTQISILRPIVTQGKHDHPVVIYNE